MKCVQAYPDDHDDDTTSYIHLILREREREGKKRGRKRKDIIMAGVPVTFIKYVSILSRREIFIWIQRATLFYVLSLIPVGCVVVSVVVVF